MKTYFLPLFAVLIVAEILWFRRKGKTYDWRELLGSLGVAVGHHATQLATLGAVSLLGEYVYEHRVFTIPLSTAWSIVVLFVGVEFLYYWFHRASHHVRWMWASHAVHHSANQLTFAAAYRLAWTGLLSGAILFWLPLMWIGFRPQAVFAVLALNLAYQFLLHTEMIPKLGILEKFLNTPSHHRVHHASNPEYLDVNFGGVLIVFDRLFGTFVEEKAEIPCRYGLTTPVTTMNPVKIALHEWAALGKDVAAASTLREVPGIIFGSPGAREPAKRDLPR